MASDQWSRGVDHGVGEVAGEVSLGLAQPHRVPAAKCASSMAFHVTRVNVFRNLTFEVSSKRNMVFQDRPAPGFN